MSFPPGSKEAVEDVAAELPSLLPKCSLVGVMTADLPSPTVRQAVEDVADELPSLIPNNRSEP